MDLLHARMKPLVEARWFEVVMSLIIFANPLAIFPQVLIAFTAPSVEGIAAPMWYIFAAIQAAFVFHGIKTKSASVVFSMFVSLLESIAIIAAVHIRG
ncbi:hypothetical protein L0Y49_02960 [bacterium]|nr:hypothetical protein [bacterium]